MTRATRIVYAVAAVLICAAAVYYFREHLLCRFHPAVQFAGSADRLDDFFDTQNCASLSRRAATVSIAVDSVFACALAYLLNRSLMWLWSAWRIARLTDLRRVVVALPLAALALDLTENVAILLSLKWEGSRLPTFRHDALALVIVTIAWTKWLCLVASGVAVVQGGWSRIAPKFTPGDNVLAPIEAELGGLGICCSGGGIRSAGYTLGALRSLDDAGILRRARWLAAVSGGAYVAGGLVFDEGDANVSPAQLEEFLTEPARRRHRYLSSAAGGISRTVLWVFGLVAVNLLILATAVVAVAWPVGSILPKWFWMDRRKDVTVSTDLADLIAIPPRLWAPSLIMLGAAIFVFVVSALLPQRPARRAVAAARATFGASVALLAVLVLAPIVVLVPLRAAAGLSRVELFSIAGVTVGAVLGALWSIVKAPLRRAAPRLGGVLLAAALVLFASTVARDAYNDTGRFASAGLWGAVTLALAATYTCVGTGWMSLRLMYRSRLRESFSVRTENGMVVPRRRGTHRTWATPLDSGAPRLGPELLLCAAAQRVGFSNTGIPATSFTISESSVRWCDTVLPTPTYMSVMRKHLKQETTISSWQATTGAAVSSAMGRMGLGTTNALLAALNLDLGGWLPNPKLVAEGGRNFRRVRLGYLVKELLGIYDENDEYVFVSDGGHWENLGLVELLRRRCSPIICIDASGDRAGSFSALRHAVDLAGVELGTVSIGLEFLKDLSVPAGGSVAPTTVGTAEIRYEDRPDGMLIYAKAQPAADLSLSVRRFAARDAVFPRYSTSNQFLTDEQFAHLVLLGRDSGERAAALYRVAMGLTPS